MQWRYGSFLPSRKYNYAIVAINGGKGKGSAFRAMAIQKLFLVTETKFTAIAVDGGKGKGSAFREQLLSTVFAFGGIVRRLDQCEK